MTGSGERSTAITVAIIGVVGTVLAAVIPLYLTGIIGGDGGGTGKTVTPTISTFNSESPSIFLSKEAAPGGAAVLVSGQGFGSGETVDIRVHTYQVATTRAGTDGKFSSVSIVVPTQLSQFAPQQFDVSATGRVSIKSARSPLEVSG